ncbi:hypothetical protein BGX26_005188 [Mortierella sp. AD094]|nr:hypothetical protein BGX26_005188 [Mortierella sp. AD094]
MVVAVVHLHIEDPVLVAKEREAEEGIEKQTETETETLDESFQTGTQTRGPTATTKDDSPILDSTTIAAIDINHPGAEARFVLSSSTTTLGLRTSGLLETDIPVPQGFSFKPVVFAVWRVFIKTSVTH